MARAKGDIKGVGVLSGYLRAGLKSGVLRVFCLGKCCCHSAEGWILPKVWFMCERLMRPHAYQESMRRLLLT